MKLTLDPIGALVDSVGNQTKADYQSPGCKMVKILNGNDGFVLCSLLPRFV